MTSLTRPLLVALLVSFGLLLAACGDDDSVSRGEHDRIEGEHDEGAEGGDGGEESGTQYAKTGSYDEARSGARLRRSYDADQDAFVGTVTNTTDSTLDQVRIEVHLSNGTELGPTNPGDLGPGDTEDISLSADGETFDTWSAHPEVGRDEHGGQGDEEHSG